MAKLTQAHVKALHDKLGEELAAFFADAHGVEGDEPETENDDTAETGEEKDEA
jgi:hypothetical protein